MSVAVTLADDTDLAGWRAASRRLLAAGVPPEDPVWSVGAADDLFAAGADALPAADARPVVTVPRAFLPLAETVIQAREPARFALLYRLLWRLTHGERDLLEIAVDPDIHRAAALAKSVGRDTHKMRAFLRFRELEDADGPRFLAWFEPAHHIVAANAPFFVRRFASMRWSILTPDRSAHWDGAALHIADGADPRDVPTTDALEAHWRTYYASIFNPARLKIAAMTAEMPKKYWKNLPEAALIPDLIRAAGSRTQTMIDQRNLTAPHTRHLPRRGPAETTPDAANDDTLDAARARAGGCRACPLWAPATQTVFGEGPADARIMMVGEQPGDQEDLAGHPFVGPAGQMLDRALGEAGLDRAQIYVTNAVKHFKFEPRGKRRIHQKPNAGEIKTCRSWLQIERDFIRPRLTLLLGASAAHAVLGKAVAIGKVRGQPIDLPDGGQALVTVHPSYLLRLPDEDAKRREYARFVEDLRQARGMAEAA